MKNQHQIIRGLFIIVLIGFLLMMLSRSNNQKTILPMTIHVGDHLGFNIDGSGIAFGTAMPGNTVERTIMLTGDRESYVTLQVKEMEFVTASEPTFILKSGTTKYVSLYATIPPDMKNGDYAGSLEITSKAI